MYLHDKVALAGLQHAIAQQELYTCLALLGLTSELLILTFIIHKMVDIRHLFVCTFTYSFDVPLLW